MAARWKVEIFLSNVQPYRATKALFDFLLETARVGNLCETIAAMTHMHALVRLLGQHPCGDGVATALMPKEVKTYRRHSGLR